MDYLMLWNIWVEKFEEKTGMIVKTVKVSDRRFRQVCKAGGCNSYIFQTRSGRSVTLIRAYYEINI